MRFLDHMVVPCESLCVYMNMWIYMWKVEDSFMCCSSTGMIHHVFFETRSLAGLGLTDWARLAGQQVMAICPSVPPKHWDSKCVLPCLIFCAGSGHQTWIGTLV